MKHSHKQTTSKAQEAVASIDQPVMGDLKNATLVVSLLLNAVLLIGFMIVQLTSIYDHQVISLLLAS